MSLSAPGYCKKDKRLLVLLALGSLIIFMSLDSNYTFKARSTGFYWLELSGKNKSLYRSSSLDRIVAFSQAQGKNNSAPLGNTTLDMLTKILTDRKVVAATITPNESFTLAAASPKLSFFLHQPLLINYADSDELTLIPGIGSVLAGKIIDYRLQNGPLDNKNSLLAIPGIGPKTASRIAPFLRFE